MTKITTAQPSLESTTEVVGFGTTTTEEESTDESLTTTSKEPFSE